MFTKKLIPVLLIIFMILTGALAESAIPEEFSIAENTMIEADLDGDSTMEKVSWTAIPVDEYDDKNYIITVDTKANDALTYTLEGGYLLGVYVADLDGDGKDELLLTGDEASDDYITICLHLFKGRLEPAMFADCTRTDYNHGYDKYGYGKIVAIDGNRLTLSGSQDVLGTWFGSRIFTLADTGVFEFDDNGKWVRDINSIDDDTWEYASLKTKAELPYTTTDGKEATLPVGTQLVIVSSDKQTADFMTKDGVEGAISIYPNFHEWGSMIDNKPEDYYFEYVPYAD